MKCIVCETIGDIAHVFVTPDGVPADGFCVDCEAHLFGNAFRHRCEEQTGDECLFCGVPGFYAIVSDVWSEDSGVEDAISATIHDGVPNHPMICKGHFKALSGRTVGISHHEFGEDE